LNLRRVDLPKTATFFPASQRIVMAFSNTTLSDLRQLKWFSRAPRRETYKALLKSKIEITSEMARAC
jgi:hypothetical protein